jgi:murein DD-endopeptidase MepM/ murein hydrolase activator NlpD
LKLGIDKAGYLRLIHDQLEIKTKLIGLYNYFNGLTIKKRIYMITKNRSNKKQLLRYFLIIPLMVILTAAFSSKNGSVPELFPIKKGEYTKITSRYGKEFKNPATNKVTVHNGIDIKADEGVEVMATADGVILKTEAHEGYGNLVIIDHGEGFQSLYAHLRSFNTEKGKTVKKGEIIGFVGNTGYSTAPHLHFEIRLNDEKVDPEKYISIN